MAEASSGELDRAPPVFLTLLCLGWATALWLGWCARQTLPRGVAWCVYLLCATLAAAVSQLAEWSHLRLAKHLPWHQAVALALSLGIMEYLVNVPAQRLGYKLTHSYFYLSLYWSMAQTSSNILVTVALLGEWPTWQVGLGLVLSVASVLVLLLP